MFKEQDGDYQLDNFLEEASVIRMGVGFLADKIFAEGKPGCSSQGMLKDDTQSDTEGDLFLMMGDSG